MVTESVPLDSLEEKPKQVGITRFDIHQIIQHIGLMTSFIILVLTGLPLKFSGSPVSQWWVGIFGGFGVTRIAHRYAAAVMIAICIYHLLYLLITTVFLRKRFPVKMVPGKQDFVLFYREMRYLLGLTKERPQYDRFNWREKFDYWAIFWGMPVMVLSGLILMFPVQTANILPGWVIPSALTAHSDEAMLALLWIVLVHIFFNHFSPGIFPFNTSIFTGKVSKDRYRRDHPAEYQRMVKTGKIEKD